MFQSYPAQMRRVSNAFVDGDYEAAANALKREDPAGRDRLVYLMELGTVYHTDGQYASSNAELLHAVEIMKEADDRALVSLRDTGAFLSSLLINDKARPYRGEPFERVLLHTCLATNFLLMHDLENARVEILQAYEKQKEAREEREESINKTRDEAAKRKLDTCAIESKIMGAYADQRGLLEKAGNVYQNAFTCYLSSLVYEMGGETSDAYIDAKTVHSLNPDFLPARRDLLRYSRQLGLQSDYESWREQFGKELEDAVPKGNGEIVLLFECGMAPVKGEIKLPIPIPLRNHWDLVTVAIPKYRSRRNPVHAARLVVDGKDYGSSQALMDVEATAVRDLWDQAFGIAARQLLRASGRIAAQEVARRELGPLALFGVIFAGYLVEQADLRSWVLLPRDYQVVRVSVPAGNHKVDLELVGGAAAPITLNDVPVREGGVTIISLRSAGVRGTAKYVSF